MIPQHEEELARKAKEEEERRKIEEAERQRRIESGIEEESVKDSEGISTEYSWTHRVEKTRAVIEFRHINHCRRSENLCLTFSVQKLLTLSKWLFLGEIPSRSVLSVLL